MALLYQNRLIITGGYKSLQRMLSWMNDATQKFPKEYPLHQEQMYMQLNYVLPNVNFKDHYYVHIWGKSKKTVFTIQPGQTQFEIRFETINNPVDPLVIQGLLKQYQLHHIWLSHYMSNSPYDNQLGIHYFEGDLYHKKAISIPYQSDPDKLKAFVAHHEYGLMQRPRDAKLKPMQFKIKI